MYCSPPWRYAAAAIALTITISCSRNEQPVIQRLAIVRFENLTGDESLDWMGRAASEVMSAGLAGSPKLWVISFNTLRGIDRALGARPLAAPGISTERPAALLAGATEILYGRISRVGGRLRLDAAIYDLAREKVSRTLTAAGPVSDSIIPLAGSLAGQLDQPVRPFETHNPKALGDYITGLESPQPTAAAQAFSHAVSADPDFGAVYVAWAQLTALQNDKAEAERILALARKRGNAIPELERARLDAIAAELRGDSAAALQALATVGRLNPSDLSLFRQLAAANLNARRYADAVADLKKADAIEPDDPVLLNQLGYAEMYAGNLAEARKALERYMRLRPTDPNASDSLGDVNFGLGEFGEAEKYYRQAHRKDVNFAGGVELFKAARAHLMTGDISGADAIFTRYLAQRKSAKDPAIEFRQAEWEFLSGRRREAIARLDTFARTAAPTVSPGLVSQAYAQLAIWSLEMGDRARAREFAVKGASTKSVTAMAVVARLLADAPASIAEWTARIDRALPGTAQERARNLVLAYAFLFAKQYQAAAPLLKQAYEHSAPEPSETLPVLLAWALVETGRFDEAAPLVARSPIPAAEGTDLFTSLSFPRLLFLRGEILAKQGRRQDAERNYRLFLALSGPDPEALGYENRARHALGQ